MVEYLYNRKEVEKFFNTQQENWEKKYIALKHLGIKTDTLTVKELNAILIDFQSFTDDYCYLVLNVDDDGNSYISLVVEKYEEVE